MEFLQELQGFVLKFPHGFDFPEILRAFFLQFDFFLEIFPEISGEIFLDFFFEIPLGLFPGFSIGISPQPPSGVAPGSSSETPTGTLQGFLQE